MEDTNIELRSRSRSKTPFLRSSCDREHCEEGADHLHHKTGRKTPVKRSTPIKQIHSTTGKVTPEPIAEVEEIDASPAHRTRNAMKYSTEKLIKTSDYSSEESLDRLAANKREIAQNEKNYKYESEVVTTTTTSHVGSSIGDFSGLSPIGNERSYHAHIRYQNASRDKSSRLSPAFSACSTDSSFAEQALADASALLEDPRRPLDHLPYRLYQMAGEYWNKYPKTDFTYSPLSRDRVELAPGQVAVPNMSRRSLSQFRIQGPLVSPAEFEQIEAEMRSQKKQAWDTNATKLRRRYTSLDSSEDEGAGAGYNYKAIDQRWWLTRIIMSIVTTITETTSSLYHSITGPPEKYPYRGYQQQKQGVVSQAGALLSAPFLWVYSMFQKIVTNTITTFTETVTPNHVGEYNSYKTHMEQRTVKKKKSWWPWLLLLLIPLVGYGCYSNYEAFVPKDETVRDTYEAPKFVPDSDLSKRVAALENWATGVDNKFKYYDNKISVIDNIEARIESYSIKYLQSNLIQILDIDSDDGELLLKLKQHFDRYYMSKNDAQVLSQEVHERLMGAWKPEVDEDSIRKIVQEYLAVYEKEQMLILLERFKEFIKETRIYSSDSFDPEEVKRIVAGMLDVYDADKIGKVDYALESAGGQVISTKCTELYQIKTKQYSVLGVPVWWVYTSPRHALTPGALPAECWAFQGFPGYLVIRTYAIIEVTGFSMEHMSRLLAADGKIESAPKNFSVYGLRDETDSEPHLFGDYVYDAAGTAIQYFPVKYPKVVDIGGSRYPVAYDIVELRIESNHGNPTYTCVYRFRVHGNPLSDVREAAEDSMRGDGDS